MKKMTKKDKVENYLESLMNSDGFTVENLMNMTVYDLFGNTELEGIGKTTLSGALNAFKKKYGVKAGKGGVMMHKNTKKERVERYLANLMKTDDFSVDDLMNLTVYDLFGNAELEGIGKTTLSSGISAFKKKYLKIQYDEKAADANTYFGDLSSGDDQEEEEIVEVDDDSPFDDQESFENVFMSTLEKEVEPDGIKTSLNESVIASNLNEKEIDVLKNMIQQFRINQNVSAFNDTSTELEELKQALRHFGIDFKTILEQYRRTQEEHS